jgi:hypothetical protein
MRHQRAALAAAALTLCGLVGMALLGAPREDSGELELVGANPTPSQFVAQLQQARRSQAGYLTDSENPARLIASEAAPDGRLWARARGSMAEDGALSALEQRAKTQAAELAGRRRAGAHLPRYQSVEESALASIAAQAEQQLAASRESSTRGPAGSAAGTQRHADRRHPGKSRSKSRSSDSAMKPATVVHASGLAQGKARVRSLAKIKETQRRKQLARIALLDDDRTASRRLKQQKSQILRLVEAASTSTVDKDSANRGDTGRKARVGSKLLWPGESEKGTVQVKSNDKHSTTGASHVSKDSQTAKDTAKASGKSLSWPGEANQNIKWPGERGYARPKEGASHSKGDRLAWPDGHKSGAMPLHPGPNAATQAGWHGGGWKDLNTEWSWPQEGAAPVSEGVESQLNLVLLIDGATQSTMSKREQGIFEAAVADAAGVSLQQLHVDYAVDVPGLLGHMEVSLRMVLSPGLSCGAVAARVRESVQTGKLNSMLSDFGASGLAVSLLNMSGCPAAMMPAPASLPSQAGSAPQMVGPSDSDDIAARGGYDTRAAPRGRSGLTSNEAVEAAEQVATQTAQQVASEVATASAADTAKQLEGELRTLAQKVAKATATRVAHDILKRSTAVTRGSHRAKARPSALTELEAAADQNAERRYGP